MPDFTDPFIGIARITLTDEELAQAIRIDIAAELDAINLYQAHIAATNNPVAKRIIQHIMDEEKDHVEEFKQLLYLLDSRQADAVPHAVAELEEEGGTPAVRCTPAAEDAPAEEESVSPPAAGTLTVGSLKQ